MFEIVLPCDTNMRKNLFILSVGASFIYLSMESPFWASKCHCF